MFDEWDFATKFRDVIVTMCEGVIERLRPGARYATIFSIDRANRTCVVTFPGEIVDGETIKATIPMGSIQPVRAGQIVRVVGTLGDRYIDDVMGEGLVAGGTPVGTLIRWPASVAVPSNYVSANGAYYDPATYPTLFGVYGFSQGQQGSQFRVPTDAGYIIRAT